MAKWVFMFREYVRRDADRYGIPHIELVEEGVEVEDTNFARARKKARGRVLYYTEKGVQSDLKVLSPHAKYWGYARLDSGDAEFIIDNDQYSTPKFYLNANEQSVVQKVHYVVWKKLGKVYQSWDSVPDYTFMRDLKFADLLDGAYYMCTHGIPQSKEAWEQFKKQVDHAYECVSEDEVRLLTQRLLYYGGNEAELDVVRRVREQHEKEGIVYDD